MKREELFLAIGQVENSRLVRSEMTVRPHKNIRKKFLTLLAAALAVTTLAVTACAVGAYVIYENPAEMLSSIFGNATGHDSGDYTEIPDPERPGSLLGVQPEYERVEADPTVVQEDIAPYVSPVGQSIAFQGMILTVDAFLYDSATRCGVVTYTLENGPEYDLQYDGRLGYMGRSYPADFNQYGYHYIIEEKCTDTLLAAAYCFRYAPERYEGEFFVTIDDGLTHEDRSLVYEQCMEDVKAAYTREEAIEEARKIMGDDFQTFASQFQDYEEDPEAHAAYMTLRDKAVMEYWERNPEEECQEKIYFDCTESRELKHITLGEASITVSPISVEIDIGKLYFLHRENWPVNSDLVDEIKVRYTDGTEYLVMGGQANNTLFSLNTTADAAMDTDYSVFVMMFNRVIDLDRVESVILNGTELKMD